MFYMGANLTRPDISFAVGQVSRFSQNPGMEHWKGLKRTWSTCTKQLTMDFHLVLAATNSVAASMRIMPEIWRIGVQHPEQFSVMTWQCRPPPPRTQLGQLVPVHGREYISVTLIRFVSLHSMAQLIYSS
jgi:hypothetical protein